MSYSRCPSCKAIFFLGETSGPQQAKCKKCGCVHQVMDRISSVACGEHRLKPKDDCELCIYVADIRAKQPNPDED